MDSVPCSRICDWLDTIEQAVTKRAAPGWAAAEKAAAEKAAAERAAAEKAAADKASAAERQGRRDKASNLDAWLREYCEIDDEELPEVLDAFVDPRYTFPTFRIFLSDI